MKRKPQLLPVLLFAATAILFSCNQQQTVPSKEVISQVNLKRGAVISCSPAGSEFGTVDFDMSCDETVKKDFNLAMELLHSFEYDEAEKAFAKVIDQNPGCAMAYWGVAMANFHALWSPPTPAELQKGSRAIAIAKSITKKTGREAAYIDAIAAFYNNWDTKAHAERCADFESAMEKVHSSYPGDKEAAIFYALSLDAAASPTDKTYAKQKKAGEILNALYPGGPNHPGIIHYIIHTYDYPELAEQALPAARKYAAVAPSSAHALHMPSHIFTRLGLWDECIQSNITSVNAAQCYAKAAGIKGHWDEELHGLDYLVYAYLQKGDNENAEKQLAYLNTINEVNPANFKVAYAFAAIPARIALENKNWKQAAALQVHNANINWKNFPWQMAITCFAKTMGQIHKGDIAGAQKELKALYTLYDTLNKQKDAYRAKQVNIQIKTCEAWMQLQTGNKTGAVQLMTLAAAMEDSTEKHPVTPGEVLPAKELLGDMLLSLNLYDKALEAYEAALKRGRNRFNSLYGAGVAAEKTGNKEKALLYFRQLAALTDEVNCKRPELNTMRQFLGKQ